MVAIKSDRCKSCDGWCDICDHPDKPFKHRKRYRQRHNEYILEKAKSYRESNREKIRLSDRSRAAIRRKNKIQEKGLCETCGDEFVIRQSQQKNCELHINKKSLRDKEYRRKYMLKRNFGITLEQYNELLEKQDNKCAICLKDQSQFSKNMSVDHNHETGEIRGILCTHCNHRIIGRHKDSSVFYRAAEYLDNHTGLYVPEKFKKPKRSRRKTKYK